MAIQSIKHMIRVGGSGLCAIFFTLFAVCAHAQTAEYTPTPTTDLIDDQLMGEIRAFLTHPVVHMSVEASNARREGITEDKILELDQQWRAEAKSEDGAQPLIAAALGSPISTYLLRVQARSGGLYTEIFVMDNNGLNVGQSSITSDYWQGDEAKVQKTFPKGAGTIFIDEPEYRDDLKIWFAQINMTIDKDGAPIGVSTVEVNLTELARRRTAVGS